MTARAAERRRAFNLLEVIMAGFLLATVSLGLMSIWVQHARSVARARNLMLASHLAQSVMEDSCARGWTVVGIPKAQALATTVEAVVAGKPVSTRLWHYVEVVREPALAPGVVPPKQVRVVVTWDEGDGLPHEVRLSTLIYWQG